ncbi:hypothetical protein [Ammoniphilus resinae]|uniref:Uncharacterized protein n=1 Tax=Ammoniphilus resinae TaxID=861532 RepID=A0ABS4GN32_9BACL|nr:hypothetical protein [Ammoniphilus resinae]MBP1931462.1 hypothetical protein [Ammoniphilus resinae]
MKIIKGFVDHVLLKEEQSFPWTFLEFLETEWMKLYEAYSNGEPLEEFTLEMYGVQIVLESGDSLPKGNR